MTKDTESISKEIAELRLQRDALRERLEAIRQDYKKGLSADSDDQAIELENAEVLEGIAKAAAEELSRIEDKLSRLTKAQAN
jgi:RNA polymerase-binding transcription factor DksA